MQADVATVRQVATNIETVESGKSRCSVRSSNLTYAFTALNSASDNVDFSTDGVNWNYTPVADAQGCDPAVRQIRVRPQGTMAAAAGENPYFEIEFRVRVE